MFVGFVRHGVEDTLGEIQWGATTQRLGEQSCGKPHAWCSSAEVLSSVDFHTGKKALNVSGPQIRRIRNGHCWSQPELAARCQLAGWDVSRDIIARIECRTRWVGDFELAILADVLKVEVPELLPQRGNAKKAPMNLPHTAHEMSFLPQEIVALKAAETPPSASHRKRKSVKQK